jgi:hypothetical protein
MKAKSFLLAISLAANLVLGWMLWQQHLADKPETALARPALTDDEYLPLPATPMPLTVSPLLPLVPTGLLGPDTRSPAGMQAGLPSPDDEKPYGPPLPPNPNAFPPWPERSPYREPQLERALLSNPER